ncbi:MaoC family dehydratase [Burkholderia sp. Ax-1719]|uniref:MaoC family dehydratase n=1 Tax=Burkholderia sp. Ax-1719 TaxID=2608334 RepID=UPI001423AA88|nr:MaoC family dehydratase [Burkholderia sp. Ax-1719]NIE63094.1 MaoC family dehydratase [Burkholderia sp. Ax-1719]
MATKERRGNFFEDFQLGQVIQHGTPRTVTEADNSVYIALTGARHAQHSAHTAASLLGYSQRPLDDVLVFNLAFGKTVPEISLNAIANLGYAELRFLHPVFSGDTLHCESAVIGLRENSNGKTGIVYVRSTCYNQNDRNVLTWIRWVMVAKRDYTSQTHSSYVPDFMPVLPVEQLVAHPKITSRDALEDWCQMTGSSDLWENYTVGERINHPLGVTVESADHMSATRLYQNNARAHFDGVAMRDSAIGQRLVYGGHVISLCRALSYDGLENITSLLAINGGKHIAPTVAGDTLYAATEILDKWKVPGRSDMGALRIRMVGIRNKHPSSVELSPRDSATHDADIVLDLDYTALIPRRMPRL